MQWDQGFLIPKKLQLPVGESGGISFINEVLNSSIQKMSPHGMLRLGERKLSIGGKLPGPSQNREHWDKTGQSAVRQRGRQESYKITWEARTAQNRGFYSSERDGDEKTNIEPTL